MSLSITDLRGRALVQPERSALFTNTALDALLVPSGVPRGRLIEVFGAPSSGKTSIAFALLAACTAGGLLAAYIDPADALFAPAAAGAGIHLSRLLVVRPRSPDAARRAVDAVVRCGACALVVFDCAGLGDVLRAHHCTRLASQAERTGTAIVALSNGDVPALASFASLRLRAAGLVPVWQEGSAARGRLAGCTASVEVVKSRMHAPGKRASIRAALPDVAGSWPTSANDANEMERSIPVELKLDRYKIDRQAAHA